MSRKPFARLMYWLTAYRGTDPRTRTLYGKPYVLEAARPVEVYKKAFRTEAEAKAQIDNVVARLKPTRVEIVRR